MSELIDTTQMYLRTIYELVEAGIEPRRARIVDRLHQAGPTVSQTVARMERDGLLSLRDGRTIELSQDGFVESRDVMRRHRLSECLVVQTIGLEFCEAHAEACRWEHVISDRVADKMAQVLGNPAVTPYGTPIPSAELTVIPSLELLGTDLVEASERGIEEAVFVLADEYAQCYPDFLAEMTESGVLPGRSVRLSRAGSEYKLSASPGQVLVVPQDFATALRVRFRGDQE